MQTRHPEPGTELCDTNRILLTQVVRAQLSGRTRLPFRLGLNEFDYTRLMKLLDNGELQQINQFWQHPEMKSGLPDDSQTLFDRAVSVAGTAEELRSMRQDEWLELANLLLSEKPKPRFIDRVWAAFLATACFQPTHLWQSLGLSDRAELSALLHLNFPVLSAGNTRHMRWKRYFYLQLCKTGGDYVCRAPSCDQCATFAECFGPE